MTPVGLACARSWINFYSGSPRKSVGAEFSVDGPWSVHSSTHGHSHRQGWHLAWCAILPGIGPDFHEVDVKTFDDLVRIIAMGPTEAAARVNTIVRSDAEHALGVSVLRLGRML